MLSWICFLGALKPPGGVRSRDWSASTPVSATAPGSPDWISKIYLKHILTTTHPCSQTSHDSPLPWGPRPSSFIPLTPLLLTPAPTTLTFLQFFQAPTVSPCQSTALFLSGTFCPHFLSSNLLFLRRDSAALR